MNAGWADDDPRLTPILLRRELIDRGHHDRALRAMVANGTIDRARRGAYVDGATWRGMNPVEQLAVRARAVLRQGDTELVVSHASAAVEWDAPLWGLDLHRVHVTRTDRRAGRAEAGVHQHRGELQPDDIVERNGLLVTSPARTVLDISATAGSEVGLVVANDLAHRGLLTPQELRERYERGATDRVTMARWPGARGTQMVLRLVDGRIESVAESRFQHLLYRYELIVAEPQYVVRDEAGREVARLDLALPELGAYINVDGKGKYAKQIAAGREPADLLVAEKDQERIVTELTGLRGWRGRWRDLEHPGATMVRVRRFLYGPDRRSPRAVLGDTDDRST